MLWQPPISGRGAIAGLLRYGGMDDDMQGGQGRPTVPPLDPRNLYKPLQIDAPPPVNPLLANAVPENVTALLTPSQQQNAVPGLLRSFGNWLTEGKGRREQIQDRVKEQLGMEALGENIAHHREGDAEASAAKAKQAMLLEQAQRMMGDPSKLSSDDLNFRLRQIHGLYASQGMTGASNPLGSAIDNLQPRPAPQKPAPQFRPVQMQDGTWTTIDEATGLDPQGKPVRGMVPRAQQEPRPQRALTTVKVNGKDVTGWANADTGEFTPIGDAKGGAPTLAQTRVQQTYRAQNLVLKNLQDAIDTYRTNLKDAGVEVWPGEKKAKLTSAYANLKLLAKEAGNLGALTGPDVKILEEMFNDPATIGSAALNVLQLGQRGKSLEKQLDQYETIVKGNKTRLDQTYGAQGITLDDEVPLSPAAETALGLVKSGKATLADVEASKSLSADEKAAIKTAIGRP